MEGFEAALLSALIKGNVTEVERVVTEDANEDYAISDTIVVDEECFHLHRFEEPTPLTVASEHGHVECVRKILEIGRDLYSVGVKCDGDEEDENDPAFLASISLPKDYFGAIVLAARKGHLAVIQELVEFRLFRVPAIYDEYAEYVTAAKDGDFQRIATLLDSVTEAGLFLKGWKGHNIMNVCLLLGCPSQCLQKMVDKGIAVDGWDYNGFTPLMCAIIGQNLECVKFLLDKGADPYEIHIMRRMSFQDSGGVVYIDDMGEEMIIRPDSKEDWLDFHQHDVGPTALMYAAAMGNIPILKLMLEGAPKDIGSWGRFECWGGIGPLDFAADYAGLEALSLILEYDAANEQVENDILCNAIQEGNKELFEFLLDSKIKWENIEEMYGSAMLACVNAKNATFLERILGCVDKNVFEIEDGTALFRAIENDVSECVDLFMKRPEFSVDVKCINTYYCEENKITSFMFSCMTGKEGFAKSLLKMGADVNARDDSGKTAVMLAARENKVKSLEFLDSVHADFDAVSDVGETVFSSALKGNGSCLEFLFTAGKVLNETGLKPMHKESLRVFGARNELVKPVISVKNFQLLLHRNVFNWDWSPMLDKKSLQNLIFVAVNSGIVPGKFLHNDQLISPFIYAIRIKDLATVRYILANMFFSSDDCQFVAKNDMTNLDESQDLAFLIEKFTQQPISLLTRSTMTVADSITSSGAVPEGRNSQVDSLPVPTAVKNTLKYKKEFSQLCPRLWKRLGPQKDGKNDEGFSYLVRNGEVVRNLVLEKCTKEECQCGGEGLAWEDVDGEEIDEDDLDSDEDEDWEDDDEGEDDDEEDDEGDD